MLDRVLYNFLHDEAKFKKSIFKKLFIFFSILSNFFTQGFMPSDVWKA